MRRPLRTTWMARARGTGMLDAGRTNLPTLVAGPPPNGTAMTDAHRPRLGTPGAGGASHMRTMGTGLTARVTPRATLKMIHDILHGAMKHAMRMELVHGNPVSRAASPPIARKEATPPDIPVGPEVLALARASMTSDIHSHALTSWQRRATETLARAMEKEEDQCPTWTSRGPGRM